MKKNTGDSQGQKKKIVVIGLMLAATAAVSVGMTFAFLTAKTEKVTNTFTGTSNLAVKIEEIFDSESAGSYTPGTAVQKQPYLKNTCSYDEYTAMQVEYYIKNDSDKIIQVTYEEFQSIVGADAIAWNTTDWMQADGDTAYSQFYYGSGGTLVSISPEDVTKDLFTTVTPDTDIESKVGASFNGKDGSSHKITGSDSAGLLPEFQIVIGGYAVSVDLGSSLDGSTDEDAAHQLKNLMDANPLSGFAAATDNNNQFGA